MSSLPKNQHGFFFLFCLKEGIIMNSPVVPVKGLRFELPLTVKPQDFFFSPLVVSYRLLLLPFRGADNPQDLFSCQQSWWETPRFFMPGICVWVQCPPARNIRNECWRLWKSNLRAWELIKSLLISVSWARSCHESSAGMMELGIRSYCNNLCLLGLLEAVEHGRT